MNNLVPTLETCKALKEAGFPQETEFKYFRVKRSDVYEIFFQNCDCDAITQKEESHGESIAAPTAEEVLRELPHQILKGGKTYNSVIMKLYFGAYGMQYETSNHEVWDSVVDDALCGVLAKMYLYLKEEGLI